MNQMEQKRQQQNRKENIKSVNQIIKINKY